MAFVSVKKKVMAGGLFQIAGHIEVYSVLVDFHQICVVILESPVDDLSFGLQQIAVVHIGLVVHVFHAAGGPGEGVNFDIEGGRLVQV